MLNGMILFCAREAYFRTLVEDKLDSLPLPSACGLASKTFCTKAPKPSNEYKILIIESVL